MSEERNVKFEAAVIGVGGKRDSYLLLSRLGLLMAFSTRQTQTTRMYSTRLRGVSTIND